MGTTFKSKCNNCGNEFEANIGGGICSFLFHCEKCGKEKGLWFRDIGNDLVRKYRLTESERMRVRYRKKIDEKAGNCRCRGKYKLFAPPRCPKCRSSDLENGHIICNYD